MKFKEIDVSGEETLQAISNARNFNQWVYDTIKKFCSGKILEVGSGIGNISIFFIQNGQNIFLSDIREQYRLHLRKLVENDKVINLDLVYPDFDEMYNDLLGQFETVFALNVLEHIKNDRQAVKNINKLLKPNGRAIILVPAYSCLYNSFDKELMHYRRYNQKTLSELLKDSGFKIIHKQYFNFFGILGWWFVGGVLKRKIIPASIMRLYNQFVSFFKLLDKVLCNKIGLSVIVVGEKV